MGAVTWGPEIPVNGKRPAWLSDDDRVFCQKGWSATGEWLAAKISNWHPGKAIRLPADHFAYKALAAGFEPWGGGEASPSDWDEGEVRLSNGRLISGRDYRTDHRGVAGGWTRLPKDVRPNYHRIIGYRKRAEPAVPASDDLLSRMFAHFALVNAEHPRRKGLKPDPLGDEARAIYAKIAETPLDSVRLIERHTATEWHALFGDDPFGAAEFTLRALGLIREETAAERFTRQTGHPVTPAVAAALEWERGA